MGENTILLRSIRYACTQRYIWTPWGKTRDTNGGQGDPLASNGTNNRKQRYCVGGVVFERNAFEDRSNTRAPNCTRIVDRG